MTPALWFAAGAVVAGAAVLLLAPTAGKKVRQRIASFFEAEAGQVVSTATSIGQRIEEVVKNDASSLKSTPNGAEHVR